MGGWVHLWAGGKNFRWTMEFPKKRGSRPQDRFLLGSCKLKKRKEDAGPLGLISEKRFLSGQKAGKKEGGRKRKRSSRKPSGKRVTEYKEGGQKGGLVGVRVPTFGTRRCLQNMGKTKGGGVGGKAWPKRKRTTQDVVAGGKLTRGENWSVVRGVEVAQESTGEEHEEKKKFPVLTGKTAEVEKGGKGGR